MKEPARTRLEGYLQTALMDCILEKTNEDGERIEKLERMTEICLRKVLRGHDPQPALGPAAPAREQGPEGEQGPHADGVIQYDADGQAVALPRAVLLQKGFAAGKMYYKGKDQEAKQVWKLLSVSEEGTCDFCLLTHTGSESAQHLEMNAAATASKFKPWNKEFEFLLDPFDLRRKADFKKDVVAGRVLDALLVLAESLPDAPVRVQLKPYKCLRASQDIEARGLQLAPLTKAVSIAKAGLGAGGSKQTICTLAHGDGTETKCILGAGPVKPEECVFFGRFRAPLLRKRPTSWPKSSRCMLLR